MKRSLASSIAVSALIAWSAGAARAQQRVPAPAAAPAQTDTDVEVQAAPAPTLAPDAGEDLEVPASTGLPPSTPAGTPASAAQASTSQLEAFNQHLQALEQHNSELEARLKALEDEKKREQERVRAAATKKDAAYNPLGTRLSAYLQAQYESSQLSEDQLQQGGAPLNRDRFVLRRARLRFDQGFEYAALSIELDANNSRGAVLGLRRAEGSLLWRNPDPEAPPYAKLTAGLQDMPFGLELPYGDRQRVFMERSQASLAFFPAVPDIGASVSGGLGPLRYSFAALNGQPVDSAGGLSAVDPNKAKDAIGRVGIETKPEAWALITGGVSFLSGTGFHADSDASKSHLAWSDANEDSKVQQVEINAVPGAAAKPAKNFGRWAVNADAQLGIRTRYGWSKLYAEVTMASNLDRGLFVADPIAASRNIRELGYYVAFVQEVTPYGLVGFRTDYYDGDSDFLESRRGHQVPVSRAIRAYSPLIGVVLPHFARLIFQYDFITDALARNTRGEPTDLRNNQWTLRLQLGL